MATSPDPHPDSPPQDSADGDQLPPGAGEPDPGTAWVEPDSPGMPGGTAGTGGRNGENKVQDDIER